MHDAIPCPPAARRSRRLDVPAIVLAAATAAGWGGGWYWLLDIAAHFRWYWLLLALACLGVTWRRTGTVARCCLALAVLGNAGEMLPYWLPDRAAARATDRCQPPLSLVTINVLTSNQDKAAVLAYLRDRDPDMIVALEVDDAWAAALGSLSDRWPHAVVQPRDDNFGIALLTRRPPGSSAVREFGGADVPSIVADFVTGSDTFTLVATHPVPPKNPTFARTRDAHLRAIADFVAAAPKPCVVAGDLNTTPWSAAFRDLVGRSGLRDTALGRGLPGTWNARLWAPRIPIDHVLVPPGTDVLRRTVGPDVGSDHFPVAVELRLPAAR